MKNYGFDLDVFIKEDSELEDKWVLPQNSVICTDLPYVPVCQQNICNETYKDSGNFLLKDEFNNCMFGRRDFNKKINDKYFCIGLFESMRKEIIYFSKYEYEVYFLVKIIDKNRCEKIVPISEEDLNSHTKVFNIFSEYGIIFSKHLGQRDSLDLLLNYLYSKIVGDVSIYHYKPGWYNGNFEYCIDARKVDTPFFNKHLVVNDNISQIKAANSILKQVQLILSKSLSFIFFIIQHYAMVISLIPEKHRLKKPIVIYGKTYDLELTANQLFKMYNRNDSDIIHLSNKDIIKYLDDYKDEIVLIRDCPCTDYKKKVAQNKYQDILEYMKGKSCECLCMILSDCGVVKGDENNIHVIVDGLNITYENDTDIFSTHVKYFTDWLMGKIINPISLVRTDDIETDNIISLFYTVLIVISKYYNECANIDLLERFGFEDNEDILSYITDFVLESTKYIGGSWICEKFKNTYLEFRNSGKLIFYSKDKGYDDINNDKILVMEDKNDILIRNTDFDKFLKCYPENVRRIDILKELRQAGVLTVDDSTRFTRNKFIKGKIVDMISVNKQFLEPDIGEI